MINGAIPKLNVSSAGTLVGERFQKKSRRVLNNCNMSIGSTLSQPNVQELCITSLPVLADKTDIPDCLLATPGEWYKKPNQVGFTSHLTILWLSTYMHTLKHTGTQSTVLWKMAPIWPYSKNMNILPWISVFSSTQEKFNLSTTKLSSVKIHLKNMTQHCVIFPWPVLFFCDDYAHSWLVLLIFTKANLILTGSIAFQGGSDPISGFS